MQLVFPEQPDRPPGAEEAHEVNLIRDTLACDLEPERVLALGFSNLIPVYSISITAARLPHPLSQVTLTAWKCCIFSGLDVVGEVDYQYSGSVLGAPVEFRRGPLCSGLIAAIRHAEGLEEAGLWEVSLLIAEGLYVEALWIRERNGVGEWLFPIPPVSKPLEPFHPYSRTQIENTLEFLAARRMGFNERL
jgi:hypothetical protein